MKMTRQMWVATGAVALIGAVAWMLPPTTPIGPGGAGARPQQVRARSTAVATSLPAPAPAVRDASPGYAPSPPDLDAAERAGPRPPRTAQPRQPDPAFDNEGDQDQPDPAFVTGYRWAEDSGIERRRACRRWRGSPAEDGCLAYLRDAEDEGGPPY